MVELTADVFEPFFCKKKYLCPPEKKSNSDDFGSRTHTTHGRGSNPFWRGGGGSLLLRKSMPNPKADFKDNTGKMQPLCVKQYRVLGTHKKKSDVGLRETPKIEFRKKQAAKKCDLYRSTRFRLRASSFRKHFFLRKRDVNRVPP